MPLPTGNIEWPPESVRVPREHYRRWGAWYSGNTDELSQIYNGSLGMLDPKAMVIENASLITRLKQRMFWGSPPQPNALRMAKLHIPLAGDIAATSADLLFGEPIKLPVPDSKPAQKRLEFLLDDGGVGAALLEAGEVCAGPGGVYVRVGWDKQVADHVLVDAIAPDAAVPEWRSGQLVAVTFWRQLGESHGDVWRHLERHEVVGNIADGDGTGVILHGLYKGTGDRLGEPRDLRERPETAPFAGLADREGRIVTGARRLAVEYVPNMRPNKAMRGSPLGRSDYDGIEPVFDALDEVWTSWLRDIRIGKGRLVIPDLYLQSQGRGKGAAFDPEQEVYQTLDALVGGDGLQMQVVQFAIRVAEHQETAQSLISQALRSAGYSVQTFGEDSASVAATATEIRARQARSFTTRRRKIGYWRPRLARLFASALEIEARQFKTPGIAPGVVPSVLFPDGWSESTSERAQSIQMLHAAEAISLYTRVKLANPDWEEPDVLEEVDRIRGDQRAMLPDMAPPGQASSPAGGATTAAAGKGSGAGAATGDPRSDTQPANAGAGGGGRRPVNVGRR